MAKGDITIVDGVEYVQTVDDGYAERCQVQLDAWVAGTSTHNTVDGECCPDFSCCNTDVRTPVEMRERFARAQAEGDEKTKMAMLGGFLGAAIASALPDTKVYVTGDGSKHD